MRLRGRLGSLGDNISSTVESKALQVGRTHVESKNQIILRHRRLVGEVLTREDCILSALALQRNKGADRKETESLAVKYRSFESAQRTNCVNDSPSVFVAGGHLSHAVC